MTAPSFKYHLFVSYTRTPDGALAREVERFLESFHKTPMQLDETDKLTPLRICVDGSDFSLPPIEEVSTEATRRDALSVVYKHLAMSRELLVLCSARAAQSHWVTEEIRWFLEHRGPAAIRLAYTEGAQPWGELEKYFSSSVLEHELHKGIAYDLRGHDTRRAQGWKQVPEFQREMVRLAADLLGLSAGDLYPTWLEAELERTRRQSLSLATTARFETLAGDPSRALLTAYDAHELHPSEATEAALCEAYKVAVLHHHNRRESSVISGSGPSYLASRWKQGEVFTKASPDGKYRLLVTERGKDGPHPPGDVYLISNETLRAVMLQAPEHMDGRVEEVAFDRTSRWVFVTRYFNLAVYTNEGQYVGEYQFSRHTKSPVHLVDGLFAGKYILGAETKGGVWLVDLNNKRDGTLKVLREFHGDVTLFTDISPNGNLALLLFESGRAALLTLDNHGEPQLTDFEQDNVLFVGFASGRNDLVITSSEDGRIVLWRLEGNTIGKAISMNPLPSAVDWVNLDENSQRLAAVGADQNLYVVDCSSGERLDTLNYSDAIDWAAVRSVAVPPLTVERALAQSFGETVSFPSLKLLVSNLQCIDGMTWMFTEDWSENDFFPTRAVYRVEGHEAILLPDVQASLVEQHSDLLWMRVGLGYGGKAYQCRDEKLHRFPNHTLEVLCMYKKDGVIWVGTSLGAYRHEGDDSRLVTPFNLSVGEIREIGGYLWVLAKEGAYIYENERLIRISTPFLDIREIKEVGGDIWIHTKTDEIFDSSGPVYRVNGYFSHALPSVRSKIAHVIEADGVAWLSEGECLHRVEGDDIRTIKGFSSNVSDIVQIGRTLWLATFSRGLFASQQQLHRMDADTLVPEALDIKGGFIRAAGRPWLQYQKDGQSKLAELREDGLCELDFGRGEFTAIAERDGYAWFLTTAGAYHDSKWGIVAADLPEFGYYSLVNEEAGYWLFSQGAAVYVSEAGASVFKTDEYRPTLIRRVADYIWILTKDECSGVGPVYRVENEQAIAVRPTEGGVTDVVEANGEVWLVTKIGQRAGPLVKV